MNKVRWSRLSGAARYMVLASIVLGAALLAACSDDEDSASPSASATGPTSATGPSASSGSTGGGELRTVEDFFGEVEVPTNPQRVVAADSPTLGNVLALGVTPVAAGFNPNSLPSYLEGMMEGVEDIRVEGGIDLEKALALNADLIIGLAGSAENPFGQESCELYAQALPTFCYEYWYAYEEEIKKNLTEIGRALNLEDKAQEVIAEYDARVAELKAKVEDVGFTDKPVTVVRIFQDGNYSIRIGTSESIIFRDVGIPQPEGQQNPDDFAIDLSLENLNVLNEAYAVLVYVDDNATVTQANILNNDVWKSLTPVQEGRIVFVNSGIWNSVDILGAMRIMDDVEQFVLPLAEG